jgi:hypothetical protein
MHLSYKILCHTCDFISQKIVVMVNLDCQLDGTVKPSSSHNGLKSVKL